MVIHVICDKRALQVVVKIMLLLEYSNRSGSKRITMFDRFGAVLPRI